MRATLHRLQEQLAAMDPSWCISICATDHRLQIFAPLLLERCGEVTSSLAELLAIPLLETQRRLVICDDGLSDGGAVELVQQLRQRYSHERCRVLIVVDPAINQQRLEQLWRCGPDGLCCLEHCGQGEGMQAILSALQGITCCDHDLQRRLQQPYRPCSSRHDADQLRASERALIQAVARGHTSRQIGALLQLRDDTVRRRLSALYHRLEVRDQRGLIAWALPG
jgi:DNA-binding NarL/FixJ family response regulator